MSEFVTGATVAATLVQRARVARELAQKIKDVELQAAVLALREEAVSLTEELVHLRAENLALRETLSLKEDLVFERNAVWRRSDSERKEPFCQRCWEAEQKLIHFQAKQSYNDETFWYYECPSCKGGPGQLLRPTRR